MRDFLMVCGLSAFGYVMWKLGQMHANADEFTRGMRCQATIMAEQRAKRVEDLAKLVFSHENMIQRLRESRNVFRGQDN